MCICIHVCVRERDIDTWHIYNCNQLYTHVSVIPRLAGHVGVHHGIHQSRWKPPFKAQETVASHQGSRRTTRDTDVFGASEITGEKMAFERMPSGWWLT